MDVKERNEILANIRYLSECANILYTKIRAIGSFYEQDSTNQGQMVINVEDYRHGTVSIPIKKDVICVLKYASKDQDIYMATAETLDIQMETEDIYGFCEDIKNFAEKVKKIVYGRKKKLESQGDSFGDTNRRNQNNNTEFDKDI